MLFILLTLIFLGVVLFFLLGRSRETVISSLILRGERFEVFLADDILKQAQGLSGRSSIDSHEGMLFTFSGSSTRTFWMKGMLFSIDIIWIQDSVVVGFEKNVPYPKVGESFGGLTLYTSPVPVDTVLEVLAGTVERLGVQIGDVIEVY